MGFVFIISALTAACGGGAKVFDSNGSVTTGVGGSGGDNSSGEKGGVGGNGGTGGESATRILQTGFYWGPEVIPLALTTEAQFNPDDHSVDFRVCFADGEFGGMVDVQLWAYNVPLKEKGGIFDWIGVSAGKCTEWLNLAAVPLGFWLEPYVVVPSGSSEDNCPNEDICANSMQTLPDNVFRSTAFQLTSDMSDGGGAGGMNEEEFFMRTGCFWGPEVGSPVLTTEVEKHNNDKGADFRVCKCEGEFANSVVDVELWTYSVVTGARMSSLTWTAVSVVNTACTEWFDAGTDIPVGLWMEPRIVSPSGPSEDNCSNEDQCSPQQGLPDNTYRSTAFRFIDPSN